MIYVCTRCALFFSIVGYSFQWRIVSLIGLARLGHPNHRLQSFHNRETKHSRQCGLQRGRSATGLELGDRLRSPALMLDASLHSTSLRKLKKGCHAKGVRDNNVQCSMGGSKVRPTTPTSAFAVQLGGVSHNFSLYMAKTRCSNSAVLVALGRSDLVKNVPWISKTAS